MQIRFLKAFKHRGVEYGENDVTSTLPDDEAIALVEQGFAEDVEGKVATGAIDKNPRDLKPKNVQVTGGVNNG